MTPYGDASRLGESIDPRLMAQDFSGFARAGAIKGQTLANLGQNIGDIIKIRGEQKKQDAVDEKFLKQGSEFFKGTPLETTFSNAYKDYTSEDITSREKRALASSIRSLIPMGMQAQEMRIGQAGAGSKRMNMTPEQYERAVASGAKMEDIVYQNGIYTANVSTPSSGILGPDKALAQRPDGAFQIVRRDTQDGASRLPYFHDQTATTPSFGGGGMPSAIPASSITDAASGFATEPPLPPDVLQLPQGGGGMSDILLGGEIPPQQQQQFEDPSLLEVGANRVREMLGQPPRAYVVDEQAPQVPAGQPAPAPAPTPSTANRPFVSPDVLEKPVVVYGDNGIESVTYIPNSMPALDAEIKRLNALKAQQELDAAGQEQLAKLKGTKDFSREVASAANDYAQLFKLDAAVGEGANVLDKSINFLTAKYGQGLARMLGTDPQVYRDKIEIAKPTLINAIRQATGMSAKAMDSDKELQFYLQALSDTTKPLAANLKALLAIERRYGVGGGVEEVLRDNPALLQRIKRFDLEFKEMAEGDDPADTPGLAPDTTDFLNTYPATLE